MQAKPVRTRTSVVKKNKIPHLPRQDTGGVTKSIQVYRFTQFSQMESATVQISVKELMELTEKRIVAETRVRELEAKIAEMLINPPKKERKPREKKVLTAEEELLEYQKRSERAKKSAATRKANKEAELVAKAEAERAKLEEEIRAQVALEAAKLAFESSEF